MPIRTAPSASMVTGEAGGTVTAGAAVAGATGTSTPFPAKAAWGADADSVWALRGINFTLEDGEFLGIAGHTGSGKSTLIQHMNGLMHPTEGCVRVDGQNLSEKHVARHVRSKVGMVFQYPEHQLFAATVFEDVAFGPRNMGLSSEEVEERVLWALEKVGLDANDVREKSPFELSGGQQRRAAFAGVLAMKPRVLVLDEPVAGLDPQAREEFLQLISRLHEQGITIAMVSHSMEDLARMCDRILVLNKGEIFALGTPAEVFSRAEEMRGIGLGVPAAQTLANSLKLRDGDSFPLTRPLYDMESLADDIAALYHARADATACAEGNTSNEAPEDDSGKGHNRNSEFEGVAHDR
ncbi:MAG: energy-coupling factor transporter ATPase [Eggerthellaceae bacterium]|nr:energy-coupling factor transporter ATPase [Eggerthellaceae bacterium]